MAVLFDNPTTAGNSLDFAAGTGFPTTEITVTWQLFRLTDRGAQFETPWSVGPTVFDAGNDYYVPFIGDGTTANTWASGKEGTDIYSNTLPTVRRWLRQAFRAIHPEATSAASRYEFYFDLDNGWARNGTQYVVNNNAPGVGVSFGATTTMTIGSNAWNRGPEAVNAWMRSVKMWRRRLDLNQINLESMSGYIVIPGNEMGLYGQWPLRSNGNDISGNGRHTTVVGTVRYDNRADPGEELGRRMLSVRETDWIRYMASVTNVQADRIPLLARFP